MLGLGLGLGLGMGFHVKKTQNKHVFVSLVQRTAIQKFSVRGEALSLRIRGYRHWCTIERAQG